VWTSRPGNVKNRTADRIGPEGLPPGKDSLLPAPAREVAVSAERPHAADTAARRHTLHIGRLFASVSPTAPEAAVNIPEDSGLNPIRATVQRHDACLPGIVSRSSQKSSHNSFGTKYTEPKKHHGRNGIYRRQ